MTIYVVVIKDRHSDIGVEIRKTHQEAREFAEKLCKEYSLDGTYEYHGYDVFEVYRYSPEGDCVLVFEKEI